MRTHRILATGLFIIFGAAGTVAGQTGTVGGQARSMATGAPIAGGVVQVLTSAGGRLATTLTDRAGRFRIADVPIGTHTIAISMTGHETWRSEGVTVRPGEVTTLHAELAARPIDLDPVVVSASRRQERALDAPARVEVVGDRAIAERPTVQPTEHLRGVPGVDVVTQGLQSTNVVARGFNNVFSGALLALTDHRIAAVPSLRVNTLYMVPATNEDIERMEVVLGPGSALYGPNTANGVLHIFTRSPLTDQGAAATLSAGDRELVHGTFRTAHRISEGFGFKVSGQHVQGREWSFEDPVEKVARERAIVIDPATRIGARDFDLRRWSIDGRADWRVSPDATAVFSIGRSTTASGIELTGLGAAQVENWSYDYYQTRFSSGRFFAQTYLNTSDAGNTYLLRDGASIVDQSRVFVAQVQHGVRPRKWQSFTYGADYIRTMPETGGTIHGRFEDEDDYTEIGAFVQSETTLTPKLELVLAGRLDRHSVVDAAVFSPRAALVFHPAERHTFRTSYNRAYSNPGSVQLFLDLAAGPVPGPAGQFGYTVRAQGTGRHGFGFRQPDGSFVMRSPFAQDRTALRTVNTANLWAMQVRAIAAVLVARGTFTPAEAQAFVGYMSAQQPQEAQVGVAGVDPITGAVGAFAGPKDVPGIRESNTTSYELGYKGILGGRILLAADVWYAQRDDFVSPLIAQTPFVLLDPQQLVPYARPRIATFLLATGMPPAAANAAAAEIAAGMAAIPGGVVSSADVQAAGAELLVSYRNFGEIDLWGSDLSATALLGSWTVGLSASLVSDDHFRTEGQIVTLNAPKEKGSLQVGYRDEQIGFSGQARLRYLGGFPVNSGVYLGIRCIEPSSLTEPCVRSSTLVDLDLGYPIPRLRGTSLQLSVSNLFDSDHRSFVGVPTIGRMALLRLKHEF